MLRKHAALIVTVLIFVAIVAGQALAYYAVPYRYDASAAGGPGSNDLTYTVSTNSAVDYTVAVFDNARPADKLYVYYDEGHAVYGTTHASQKYFISQTLAELRIRGFTNTETVNAEQLVDIVSAYRPGDAVLMTSGVLPAAVYSDSNNGIFDWVAAGGTLYWTGYAIGAKFAEGNVLKDVATDYQFDIFGASGCILTDAARSTERSHDPLSKALMLTNDNVTYGINVSSVGNSLSLGFEYEGYSSTSLIGKGNGMICVLGGSLDSKVRTSVSQIISSGVSWGSQLIGTANGSLVRGDASGTIDTSSAVSTIGVHIRMGEPYTVYARTFFF